MRKPLPLEESIAEIRNIIVGSKHHINQLIKSFLKVEELLNFYPTNKRFIILHHSLTKDSKTVSWNPIRQYHIDTFNEKEIGYNFGIEQIREEDIYEILIGRSIREKGVHCLKGNMNELGIGFMFCGNFDIEQPPQIMLKKASQFIAELCILTNIPPENIKGHRDYDWRKTCPGKMFDIDSFRNRVVNYL